jgi:hypothetical protein
MRAGALNLLVFREDRRRVRGEELKAALLRGLDSPTGQGSLDQITSILLRAGELEGAMADAGSAPTRPWPTKPGPTKPGPANPFMNITDRLAECLVSPECVLDPEPLKSLLAEAAVPGEVEIAPAEGFAYYAIHPLAYAEVLDKIPALPASLAVVGIRSIGTTLSAVTAAAVRARGIRAERITVRPAGHPYNRSTQFSPAQKEFIRRYLAQGADFLIVDEGPGLSGSSFLSVAEALVEAGVSHQRIILICGHEPEFDVLCADDGPRRARRFRWLAVSAEPRRPAEAKIFIGGGEWRTRLFGEQSRWPESWINFERLKYLSSAEGAETRLFKFIGLGHYGDRVREREENVAAAGFGAAPQGESEGFSSYAWITGRPMCAEDLSEDALARLAAYCAFRAEALAAELADLNALEQMAEHNLHELGFGQALRLRLERPVLADGRMQPHEWLLTGDGRMLKTDSGSHGDDHFFPGPTDIAWDLAGAIVEWKMNPAQEQAFLESYRRASGDDASARIADFITAYAVFRCAYCCMAAGALQGNDEQARLERAAVQYSAVLLRPARPVSLALSS